MRGHPPAVQAAAFLGRPRPWLVGVLHLPALPGAPRSSVSVDTIAEHAVHDARLLEECGFTAVLVENFHDVPFCPGRVEPETVAAMAVVTAAVRGAVSMPVGVNVLRNDALAALGVAVAAGAGFLRVNVLTGAAVTDQGIVTADAYTLLRRRAALAARVEILADVDVKHSHPLDPRPVAAKAKELVQRALADAVLVTGGATGEPVDVDTLAEVAAAVAPVPVLAASGTHAGNLSEVLHVAAGAIVGTALQDPSSGRVDARRAAAYAKASHP